MKTIKKSELGAAIDALIKGAYKVVAPVKEKDYTVFKDVKSGSEADFSQVNTRKSFKEFLFPACEKLFSFSKGKTDVSITADSSKTEKTLLIGARPCDAASLDALSRLFNWDYKDGQFNERLKNTTIAAFACDKADAACFCTSVGGAPDSAKGSDLLFKKAGDSYAVEALTDKGRDALKLFEGMLKEDAAAKVEIAALPKKFEMEKVKPSLDRNFDSDMFREFSMKCLGCGACAFICPNCHCFDIVDEGTRSGGARYRNWDGCQFAAFTLHTSGHNPRPDKKARWRQRLMHKFSYYPDRFGTISCVGCGRCIRHCPVKMNISAQLEQITKM